MTEVTYQIDRRGSDSHVRPTEGKRPLIFAVIVVLALGVWLLLTVNSGSTRTEDLEELIADYALAWQESDVDAFRGLVTEDFQLHEIIYQQVGAKAFPQEIKEDIDGTAREVAGLFDWRVDRTTSALVSGDGPWFVSVGENWTRPFYLSEGTASYVVVEEEGKLRIEYHFWAGLLTRTD